MIPRNALTPDQEAWLTALESGEYRQAKEHLCRDGAYCCLGVATHVLDPENPALRNDGWGADDYRSSDIEEMWDEGEIVWADGPLPPPEIVVRLNLQDTVGSFRLRKKRHDAGSLADLNDKVGLPFPEIAGMIRAAPWLVFTNFDIPEAAQ